MINIKLNSNGFQFPRIKMEHFTLRSEEKMLIQLKLASIENILPSDGVIELAMTREDGCYKGSIRIKALSAFCYGRGETIQSLLSILLAKIKWTINRRIDAMGDN